MLELYSPKYMISYTMDISDQNPKAIPFQCLFGVIDDVISHSYTVVCAKTLLSI